MSACWLDILSVEDQDSPSKKGGTPSLATICSNICRTWLALEGYEPQCRIVWEEITMQDEVDHANARYLTARARQLEQGEEDL